MGIGLAGIAQGIKEGFQNAGIAARQMEEDTRKQEAAERDKKRFTWEEADAADKQRSRDVKKQLDDDLTRLNDLYATGGGVFSEFGYGSQGQGQQPQQTQENPTANPDAAQPAAQPRMGLSIPLGGQPAPAPAAGGLSAPGGEQPTAMPSPNGIQPQQAPSKNPFMTGGEGKYANSKAAQDAYYAAKSQLLQRYFERMGEHEKALAVPEAMAKARDFQFEEKTGAALAAMAAGLPNAPAAMSRIYDLLDDGKKLDPNSGKFDPKTGTWSGLKVTDKDGKTSEIALTQGQIFALAKQKDAAALVKFNLERSDKAFDQGLKEREVRSGERTAAAHETTAAAAMLKAKTGADENDILRRSKIDAARVSAVNDMIQNTYKAPQKLDDLTVMSAKSGDKGAQAKVSEYEAQMRAYEGRQAEVQKLRDRATTLLSLNPKLTASEAVAISKDGAKLQLQRDDNGDYVTYGGKKVYVN